MRIRTDTTTGAMAVELPNRPDTWVSMGADGMPDGFYRTEDVLSWEGWVEYAPAHPVLRGVHTWYLDRAPKVWGHGATPGDGGDWRLDVVLEHERRQLDPQWQAAFDDVVNRAPDATTCDRCWHAVGWTTSPMDERVLWMNMALTQDAAAPDSRVVRVCENCAPDVGLEDHDARVAAEAKRAADA